MDELSQIDIFVVMDSSVSLDWLEAEPLSHNRYFYCNAEKLVANLSRQSGCLILWLQNRNQLDGVEFCECCQAVITENRHKFLLVSGNMEAHQVSLAYNKGVHDVLDQNWPVQVITQKLQSHLKVNRVEPTYLQPKLYEISLLIRAICHDIASPVGTICTGTSFLLEETKLLKQKLADQILTPTELEQFLQQLETVFAMNLKNSSGASKIMSSFRNISVPMCIDEVKYIELAGFVEDVVLINSVRLKYSSELIQVSISKLLSVTTYIGSLAEAIGGILEYTTRLCMKDKNCGKLDISAKVSDELLVFSFNYSGNFELPDDTVLETILRSEECRPTLAEIKRRAFQTLKARVHIKTMEAGEQSLVLSIPLIEKKDIANKAVNKPTVSTS